MTVSRIMELKADIRRELIMIGCLIVDRCRYGNRLRDVDRRGLVPAVNHGSRRFKGGSLFYTTLFQVGAIHRSYIGLSIA